MLVIFHPLLEGGRLASQDAGWGELSRGTGEIADMMEIARTLRTLLMSFMGAARLRRAALPCDVSRPSSLSRGT
jgi:hypothetical protein